MTAVADASELLAKLTELNEVYERNIPKEDVNNVDVTVARVDSVNNAVGTPGNETFYSVDSEVEVQVFYAVDFSDFDGFEIKLLKLFTSEYWGISSPPTQSTDPDTYQVTSTFYFNRTKYI